MKFEDLKNLDKDPGRWPLPVRVGAIALFFVLLSGGMLYFLVWDANKDELDKYQREEQTLRQEFRTKHSKAANLQLYKQQLDDIGKTFGTMLRQLPGKAEVDSLLTDIAQTGGASGLTLELFKPMPEENKEFYALKPIQIRFTGSYHQIGEFVSGIAALPRIVTLHDVSIKVTDKGNAVDKLQMEVTARTYRYLDENEVAAGEAARKKTTARGSSSS